MEIRLQEDTEVKIYLAGPMRGIKDFNFPAFHAETATLRACGHDVFNAAEYEESMFGQGFANSETGDLKDIQHLEWNFRDAFFKDCEYITKHADAVVVLPGWDLSKGAQAEVAIARTLGLPVLHAYSMSPVCDTPPGEWRITDPQTGGQKGSKLERFDLIPAEPLEELARVYGRGATKYEDNNWKKGYKWGLSFAALMRHAWKFWRGESVDELGNHHLACVAWHCLTLMWFEKNYPEGDNREKAGRKTDKPSEGTREI